MVVRYLRATPVHSKKYLSATSRNLVYSAKYRIATSSLTDHAFALSVPSDRSAVREGEIPVSVKIHAFYASLCPAIQRQKLLFSP